MCPREAGNPGRSMEEESSWTSALPLNFLFPGQWAAATGSGLCPSLPGSGPTGSRPIWTPYVPPFPSQQPPGPPYPPSTPSFIPVSCVFFKKHPWDFHMTSQSPPPSSPIFLLRGPCLTPSRISWANCDPPYVPTRSDMQRWLGAFPTPGPLPCSPDTIYENCGE